MQRSPRHSSAQKDLVEQKATDLEEAAKQAEALEFELRARQIEVMLRIQERQQMLANSPAGTARPARR